MNHHELEEVNYIVWLVDRDGEIMQLRRFEKRDDAEEWMNTTQAFHLILARTSIEIVREDYDPEWETS